jgi:hypothetical protein
LKRAKQRPEDQKAKPKDLTMGGWEWFFRQTVSVHANEESETNRTVTAHSHSGTKLKRAAEHAQPDWSGAR